MDNPIGLFFVSFVAILNLFVWFILPMIIKKHNRDKENKNKHLQRIITQFVQLGFTILSIIAALRFYGVELSKVLSRQLFAIGKDFVINGYVILLIISAIVVILATNRLFNKIVKQSNYSDKFPQKLINSSRRWISFLVFLILIGSVFKLSSLEFSLFSITLFSIHEVPLTIGKLIQAAFVAYSVFVSLQAVEFFYSNRISKKGIDRGKGHTIFQILKYFIWVITIVLILSNLGLSVNVLLAGSAALFVGLGFGLQSLFNDFVSGLIILFEGTIRVNDIVELENGMVGKVEEIGLRTSKLLTRDNIINIIPNNNFVGKNVINWSYNDQKTRFKVNVGVAYGSDVRLVEKILIECAQEHNKINKFPLPFVYFNEFGESSLNFSLFFWIDESFWVERVRSDLRFSIYEKFKKNNIEIPFPQRDLHIKSDFRRLND